jgi:hypothetical protein
MIAPFLIAQLTIVVNGPPLKPADAAATLRRSSATARAAVEWHIDRTPAGPQESMLVGGPMPHCLTTGGLQYAVRSWEPNLISGHKCFATPAASSSVSQERF